MLVIAGLGNPGADYALTRHNCGFLALDALAQDICASLPKEKFNGLVMTAKIGTHKVLLVKPQTFMNESGRCLLALQQFYKLPPERIAVLVDDIDLPLGHIRLRAKGGPGTHNGMRSIVTCLGTEEFPRVRIGIGQKPHPDMDLVDFVLGRFSKEEQPVMAQAFARAAQAAKLWAEQGMEIAMQQYNTTG
ncbi:MAG: aminoacyl-tRNA hydrolase [Clostridia bacterium]|nr:aminoacyl-tRNA hydrolase [Clostridia bacterium]